MEFNSRSKEEDEKKAGGFMVVGASSPLGKKEVEEEDGRGGSAQFFSHFCKECGKGFNSGKALGGHMSSAHVQAKDHFKKLKIRKSDSLLWRDELNSGGSDVGYEKPSCHLCGKVFPSRKSLYGHMRCHPEREWRGMAPPPYFKDHKSLLASGSGSGRVVVDDDLEEDNYGVGVDDDSQEEEEEKVVLENFDDVDDDDSTDKKDMADARAAVVDLTDSLSGWAVTGKRGRESLKPAPVDMESEEQEAVSQLIRLCNGESSKAEENPPPPAPEKNEVVTSQNSSTPSAEFSEDVHRTRCSNDFPLKKRKFSATAPDDDDDDADADSEETLDGAPLNNNGKRAQMGSHDGELSKNVTKDSGFYLGSSVLDGNESKDRINNVVKVMKINSLVGENVGRKSVQKSATKGLKPWEITPPPNSQMIDLPEAQVSREKHTCSTCKKKFPTHQALGGHRSSHNKLKIHLQNAVSYVDEYSAKSVARSLEWSGMEGEGGENKDHQAAIALMRVMENENNIHECKICGKTFPSGQALGGHKRCHYSSSSSSSQAPSSDNQGGSEKLQRKVFDFDLNVSLDEDHINANGCGS